MNLNRKALRRMILNEIKMLMTESIQEDMEALVAEKPDDRALGVAKFRGNMSMARSKAINNASNKLAEKKDKDAVSYNVVKFNIDMPKKKAYAVIEAK